jgi:hypothetical protein
LNACHRCGGGGRPVVVERQVVPDVANAQDRPQALCEVEVRLAEHGVVVVGGPIVADAVVQSVGGSADGVDVPFVAFAVHRVQVVKTGHIVDERALG